MKSKYIYFVTIMAICGLGCNRTASIMTGKWKKPGVYNIEEFDPDPFMDALNKWGLPWHETFDPELVD